jgi:galactose oxidase-like protein
MLKQLVGATLVVAILCTLAHAQSAIWSQQTPTGAPSLRAECGFAHDSTLGLQVMFGGIDAAGTRMNDTYLYDGVGNWSLLPLATSPSPRTCSMVYDSSRGVHVIYGGDTGGFPGPSDTWEFDGLNWAQIPTAANPGMRVETALSYDPLAAETILFSGAGLITIYAPDTWVYDGTNWISIGTSNQPGGRKGHRMVYDSARGVHVLFGGESHLLFKYNDTWEFNRTTNTWTQVTTSNSPPPRHLHAMSYDAVRGVTTIYGGSDMNGNDLGDTWEYDGTNWVQVSVGTSPSPRRGARFATNPANGSAILFGGAPASIATNATWSYANIPPQFPGTGGDCRIDVAVNGVTSFQPTGVFPLMPTDSFGLNLLSPNGGLDNQNFALVYTFYPQGSPPSGLSLVGGGPADVWIDPMNAVVLLDSLAPPTSIFVPLLLPGGLVQGPYNVPAGITGNAANLQLFVNDPGANPVNISTSSAAVLEFN